MKKLLLLLILFISYPCIGQNEALFQQWYLMSYEIDGVVSGVSGILPHISPGLTIDTDLSFSGTAACNEYQGNFSYDNINDRWVVDSFNTTINVCDYQDHVDFELDYFSFFEIDNSFSYSIVYVGYDEYLELELSPGFLLVYRDTPLIFSVSDSEFFNINIYPNPVQDILKIENKSNIKIISIKLYDVLERVILVEKGNVNQIDVSHINSGLLFVVIETGQGVITKKMIKV